MCHVTVTLRSCDFFGRVMINPQEVMMALSPEERLIDTHTLTHTLNILEMKASQCQNGDFKDLLCFFQMWKLRNNRALLLRLMFLMVFSL